MHAALLLSTPVLAAAKSKVPFYIVGGLLICWAFVLSMGIGMRRPEFPGTVAAERAVIGITAALVLVTMAMAVVTSGGPG
ncbi:MAG TPA: hypothetical protein VK756_11065 [Solirubrobacteraceae bacterium]|jgi:hypothetical protein|nr:hypothetical protein [Solirubrobacteraceae bacterium]